jgi:hypothetical protein
MFKISREILCRHQAPSIEVSVPSRIIDFDGAEPHSKKFPPGGLTLMGLSPIDSKSEPEKVL